MQSMSGIKSTQRLLSEWNANLLKTAQHNDSLGSVSTHPESSEDEYKVVFVTQIIGEEITLQKVGTRTTNEEDHETAALALARSLMPKDEPCYVLIKTNSDWVFVYCLPHEMSVRERMLYASSLQVCWKYVITHFHIEIVDGFQDKILSICNNNING